MRFVMDQSCLEGSFRRFGSPPVIIEQLLVQMLVILLVIAIVYFDWALCLLPSFADSRSTDSSSVGSC
ncbi:hypothetical protein TNIN_72351 [Trichonephila inaurata madagascariensis]|uniref:Uncharacterized protein n=1 Tax=Trichonephila inaurata madagascariensis TaxID=2747483 RepID=A0A8X7CTI5_9ARAC|nr:hypothetical protein TNIN_347931 [Trichonephila inaurata madagascariensis]GFY78656.1 hypothetical protein TNIN_72351 [Trichonephila inaurata madagascariensis]